MFFLYQVLVLILLILSPIIISLRIFKKKEDPKRFKEKFCLPSKKRKIGNLIWFHSSSVGELLSIIPLVYELEKNKNINQILITTSTLSSAEIFKNFKFKKVVHQFFPIDFFLYSYKFLNYWQPTTAIFVESEIWPSIFKVLDKKKIPLLLLNARITKKTFKKWMLVKSFSKSVFENITKVYPQNKETFKYLKKLNISQIKKIGNLKFINNEQDGFIKINKNLLKNSKVHLNLMNKYKNLLTIIIPRHVDRVNQIIQEIKDLKLNVVLHSSHPKKLKENDIYLVDTYGETKKFYQLSKIVFMGKSLIGKGGQNPLEPAMCGAEVLYGPNIGNFSDTYKLLDKLKISRMVKNMNDLTSLVSRLLLKPNNKKNYLKIEKIGKRILNETKNEINKFLNNEIKKT